MNTWREELRRNLLINTICNLAIAFLIGFAVALMITYPVVASMGEKAKQLEACSPSLCQDMRTLTLSHCFHASDGCLEQACQTVRLPDGTPLEYVLGSR